MFLYVLGVKLFSIEKQLDLKFVFILVAVKAYKLYKTEKVCRKTCSDKTSKPRNKCLFLCAEMLSSNEAKKQLWFYSLNIDDIF